MRTKAQTSVHSREQSLLCCCNKFPTECTVSLQWNVLCSLSLPLLRLPYSSIPVSFCSLMPSPHARIQRNDLPEKAQKSLSVAQSKMFVFQPRLKLISLIWEFLSFVFSCGSCCLLVFNRSPPSWIFDISTSVAPHDR